MKLHFVFDASVESYQITDRLGGSLSIDGILSVELYEKIEGKVPRYCLVYELEDNKAESAKSSLQSSLSQYSSYLSNTSWCTYKSLGKREK